MTDLSSDWELVSRRSREAAPGILDVLRRMFGSSTSKTIQATTWMVRHRTTGRVRRLTARTELEARVKIVNGLFDTA
jgi:archaeosine-15-forming tRNA-guanine transglycosylase